MSELGDVLELIHTSEQRWRSLRVRGREWRHAALNLEAFMRKVERHRPGSFAVLAASSREVEEPEETENTWSLWIQGRDRVRAEFTIGGGDMVTAVVDGETWWSWSPLSGANTNDGRKNAHTGLGPGIALVRPAVILPAVDLEIRGQTTTLGRLAYEVRAVPASSDDDEESSGLVHGIGSGAETYELLVDAERGVLLRTEVRLHDRPFLVLQVNEVAFDEDLTAETFTLVPPTGEEFETVPESRSLLLDELPAAVGFTVLIPERAPDDAHIDVMIEPAVPRYGIPEHAEVTYHTFPEDGQPIFLAIRQSSEPVPVAPETEWRDVEGFRVAEDRHTSPSTIRVRLERLGTYVELSSRDLSVGQLLDVGRSLVPLPHGTPR
jgi:outer membrane lipoprotein-sorting protein